MYGYYHPQARVFAKSLDGYWAWCDSESRATLDIKRGSYHTKGWRRHTVIVELGYFFAYGTNSRLAKLASRINDLLSGNKLCHAVIKP